jgi:phosphohistidine phosphatase
LKLYLVRHGQYVPIDISMTCPLSLDGIADIKRLASYLAHRRVKVTQIFHSSKSRARQTAEILAEPLKADHCDLLAGLEPNDPIPPMLKNISDWSNDVMLVGHLPFIGLLTNQLLDHDEANTLVNYQPGTVACLSNDNNQWSIDWVLPPGIY